MIAVNFQFKQLEGMSLKNIRVSVPLFMLLLAASEHAEKNPLEIKFRKDIVESYNIGRGPINFHVAERQSFVE